MEKHTTSKQMRFIKHVCYKAARSEIKQGVGTAGNDRGEGFCILDKVAGGGHGREQGGGSPKGCCLSGDLPRWSRTFPAQSPLLSNKQAPVHHPLPLRAAAPALRSGGGSSCEHLAVSITRAAPSVSLHTLLLGSSQPPAPTGGATDAYSLPQTFTTLLPTRAW